MIDSSNINADLFVRKGRVRILKQLRGTNPDPGLVIDWSIVEVYLYSPREGGGSARLVFCWRCTSIPPGGGVRQIGHMLRSTCIPPGGGVLRIGHLLRWNCIPPGGGATWMVICWGVPVFPKGVGSARLVICWGVPVFPQGGGGPPDWSSVEVNLYSPRGWCRLIGHLLRL